MNLQWRSLAIPVKKAPRPVLGYLSDTELAHVLAQIDPSTQVGERDYLLVALLYGLQLEELAGFGTLDAERARRSLASSNQTGADDKAQTKTIDGRARTVRELLDTAKYAIDFYQREYAWQERQVRELIDDLTGKFLDSYESHHSRHEVEGYGHYFLGSIVISHKRGQRFVVDGQQRLTTLTLVLIHLHHLQDDRDERVEVQTLIYSEKFGRKSFNLDVPDRVEVMQRLMNGEARHPNGTNESVRNIVARYANIADHLPEEVTGVALPFFIDWLLENVHLVEIEAYSDEDAYTIFETMNDRGLSLSLPEMLKGYVLANVRQEDDQRQVNTTWKQHMQALKELGDEEDVDFFKNWLRARHAETIRRGQKGAENKDYERIGTEFHRWVRDHKEHLGLRDSDSFVGFVSRDLDFYARQALVVGRAASTLTGGWESVRYNEDRGFTLQSQALLAPLSPDDGPQELDRKVALVADFLDIWLARRVWNFRTISYSSVKYTLFTGDGDHGVSVERPDARASPADRRAGVAEDDEALRPDGGHDLARRNRTHRDLGETRRRRTASRSQRYQALESPPARGVPVEGVGVSDRAPIAIGDFGGDVGCR